MNERGGVVHKTETFSTFFIIFTNQLFTWLTKSSLYVLLLLTMSVPPDYALVVSPNASSIECPNATTGHPQEHSVLIMSIGIPSSCLGCVGDYKHSVLLQPKGVPNTSIGYVQQKIPNPHTMLFRKFNHHL